MRGGVACVESAAGYEYVRSPTEYKNKIYPSPPPMKEHVEKLTGSPEKNDIKYIPVRK